jgi:hypothetical protein
MDQLSRIWLLVAIAILAGAGATSYWLVESDPGASPPAAVASPPPAPAPVPAPVAAAPSGNVEPAEASGTTIPGTLADRFADDPPRPTPRPCQPRRTKPWRTRSCDQRAVN